MEKVNELVKNEKLKYESKLLSIEQEFQAIVLPPQNFIQTSYCILPNVFFKIQIHFRSIVTKYYFHFFFYFFEKILKFFFYALFSKKFSIGKFLCN